MTFLATDLKSLTDIEDKLVAADTTVRKVLMSPQLGPVAFNALVFSNNDVIDHHVVITFTKGGVESIVAATTVPQGAGTNGASPTQINNTQFGGLTAPNPFGPGIEVAWRVEESVTLTNAVTVQGTVGGF